jgi:DNA-binding NarL/FixJ family response regulator
LRRGGGGADEKIGRGETVASERKAYKIILADDHVLIRHGIKNIISQIPDLQVAGEASNGEELLSLLETEAPDLLILDIMMPKISGVEVVGILKRRYPRIKVLMLTMHKSMGYFYSAMSAGADGYLMKGDSSEELLLAIEKIREGRTYLSPMLADDFTDDVLTAHRTQQESPFKGLTGREQEILRLVVAGYTSKAMAEKLGLSSRTVDHHRARLLQKLKVKNTVDLVNFAVRNGFVPFEDF